MKYVYLYQTGDNENRRGEISAPNRAEAYAALRKAGIRPYRLIGDDPSPWRKRLPAIVAAAAAAAVAAAALFFRSGADSPIPRRQITGDASAVSSAIVGGWESVFSSPLDRHLAAYSQPCWLAIPPEDTTPEKMAACLDIPPPRVSRSDPEHVRQVKRIVAGMRRDLDKYMADGGTLADYLAFIDERQDEERRFRAKAAESVLRAPEDLRARAALNINARLRALGMPEIRVPESGR